METQCQGTPHFSQSGLGFSCGPPLCLVSACFFALLLFVLFLGCRSRRSFGVFHRNFFLVVAFSRFSPVSSVGSFTGKCEDFSGAMGTRQSDGLNLFHYESLRNSEERSRTTNCQPKATSRLSRKACTAARSKQRLSHTL